MEERQRIRDSVKLRLGVRAFDEKIAAAKAKREQAGSPGTPDEIEALDLEVKTAEQERELFVWQHDTTGALKNDRFGADLREEFEALKFERKTNGEAGFAEGGDRAHVLLINMGELDRLNESGDHALGDTALELTFLRIQEKVRAQLLARDPKLAQDDVRLEAMYSVHRTGGADFSVTLKGVDAIDAAEIEKQIVAEPLDVSGEHAGEEATYLTSSRVSFAEAGVILAKVRPKDGDPDVDATLFVAALKEKATTLSDFERTRARLSRVVEKISASEGLSAETIYNKYHKGALGPLFAKPGQTPLEYDEFVQAVKALGALEGTEGWQREAFTISRADAIQKLQSRNSQDRMFAKHVLDHSIESLNVIAPEGSLAKPEEFPESGTQRIAREFRQHDVDAFEARTSFLGETEGERRIMDLEAELEAVRTADGPNAELKLKRAQLALDLERSKRDTLTGLAGRGIFFQNVEQRLEANQPVSIVSVDMAFLKYFDKEGGKHTGDAAIMTAARILDFTARTIHEKHGIDIEACRVGGDEFSFSVGSADPAILSEIEDVLRMARVDAGSIPSYEGALQSYSPEQLQFNLGIQSSGSPQALEDELVSAGIAMPERLAPDQKRRWLADHQNAMADGKIAPPKAISRLTFLLTRAQQLGRAPEDQKSEKQLALKTLMAYSEKAIFGAAGRDKIAQWLPRLNSGQIKLGELIRSEIIPFVREQLKAKGAKDLRLSEEMEETLEYEIRLSLNEQRISELEDRLEVQAGQLGREHEQVVSLKKELEAVRAERQEVVGLRQKIKGAA